MTTTQTIDSVPRDVSVSVSVSITLTKQQERDILRFYDTCEDGQGYDVPKDRMKSLACLGLIRPTGFSRYEITDAGDAVIEKLRVLLDAPIVSSRSGVSAKVYGYTPGMGLVELRIAGGIPSWLELGESVSVLPGGSISDAASGAFHSSVTGDAAGIEPFAWIADYAACGGGRSVFTAEQAAHNTDRMCVKTPVYTLKSLASALAAIKTLEAGGYAYKGGEMWELPVGAAPDLSQHQGAPVDLSLQSMLNLNWSAADVVRAISDQGPLYRKPPVSHGDTALLRKVYDLIGLSYSQPVSVLLANLKNIIRFSNLLHAIERNFMMVPGKPSDEPEDEGCEPDDLCLVNCWGSSEAEYIEQFRAALSTLTEMRSTELAKYIAVVDGCYRLASMHSGSIDGVDELGGDEHADPICAIFHRLYYARYLLPKTVSDGDAFVESRHG
ncbi:hypothetical protein FQ186_29130 [Pseudomonas sp. ANT_H14]|uniref:hypothetical protein n=1 Tax=unclassified Pseudomonas TaxID=196821 RepID=UPI0011EEA7BF|nr:MULTISPECIES: hypothetical protein [unclassified Pseudomonas]KAA0944857.1 hypothetical protein FQ186_29130 [Pseudomonas sp. ANT_H14]KAA0946362.1 hypothetical protein FQ182_14505 [Pseudomonas sp. ANT_H4]